MVIGFMLGFVLGGMAGGVFVYKRYRPALRALYEYVDRHAPQDQSEAISRRLGQS